MKNKKQLIIYVSIGLIAVALAAVAVVSFNKTATNNFNTVSVNKIDLSESVKATGATKAAAAVDLGFELPGKVASVPVKEGQTVKRGGLLAALSGADASSDERAAQATYDAAAIALEKLKQPPEATDVLAATDAVAKSQDDLGKAYDDSFNSMSSAFVDFSSVTSGIKSVLYTSTLDPARLNYDYYADQIKTYDPSADVYRSSVDTSYREASDAYEAALNDYKSVTRDSSEENIVAMIDETAVVAKDMADAAKAAKALVDHYRDVLIANNVDAPIPAVVPVHQATLGGFVTLANADLSALSGAENDLASSNRALSERTAALTKLQAGAEDIDIRSAQTRVDAAYASLLKAKSEVAKTALTAPFDGTVTKVNVTAGEYAVPGAPAVSVISAAGFEIETDVSEIDVGKIGPGTSATVTLDSVGANDEFGATVLSVDSAPTVINGINSYHIVLEFDKNDPSFKDGLTANIVFKLGSVNALAVPARSIVTNGDQKSVMFVNSKGVLETRPVTVGIIGDNGFVQIMSGLSEGDRVASFGGN